MALEIRDLLKHVWGVIPRKLRRKALYEASAFFAKRSGFKSDKSPPTPDAPRILVGMLSSDYSFGHVARLFAQVAQDSGADVYGIDIAPFFPEQSTGRSVSLPPPPQAVLDRPHHIILVVNGLYIPYVVARLGSKLTSNAYVSGYWAWEFAEFPETWRDGLDYLHEVIVSSQFNADGVLKLKPDVLVRLAPHPVELSAPAALSTRVYDSEVLTVHYIANLASDAERKNPIGALKAFIQAFPEADPDRAKLKMHCNNMHVVPDIAAVLRSAIANRTDIDLTYDVKSRAELLDWWKGGLVLLSLHRSEGFGLNIAEAMVSGRCAVATGYSGNMQFMNSENSICVPYTLVEAGSESARADAVWAEPDVDAAAAALKQLAQDRSLLKRLGTQARHDVLEVTSSIVTQRALGL